MPLTLVISFNAVDTKAYSSNAKRFFFLFKNKNKIYHCAKNISALLTILNFNTEINYFCTFVIKINCLHFHGLEFKSV